MQLFLQISGQVTEAFVQRCPIEIGVLKNVAKSTRKHLCQSLFFNKVRGLERERQRQRQRQRERETERERSVQFAKVVGELAVPILRQKH